MGPWPSAASWPWIISPADACRAAIAETRACAATVWAAGACAGRTGRYARPAVAVAGRGEGRAKIVADKVDAGRVRPVGDAQHAGVRRSAVGRFAGGNEADVAEIDEVAPVRKAGNRGPVVLRLGQLQHAAGRFEVDHLVEEGGEIQRPAGHDTASAPAHRAHHREHPGVGFERPVVGHRAGDHHLARTARGDQAIVDHGVVSGVDRKHAAGGSGDDPLAVVDQLQLPPPSFPRPRISPD